MYTKRAATKVVALPAKLITIGVCRVIPREVGTAHGNKYSSNSGLTEIVVAR